MINGSIVIALLCLFHTHRLQALEIPSIFSKGMVLLRERPIAVRG
jgi:hypothetical protein